MFFFLADPSHPHLNPYLCASFLLTPPKKKVLWQCGMVVGTGQGCGWECSQTMHTGGNGVMVVRTAGWSSPSCLGAVFSAASTVTEQPHTAHPCDGEGPGKCGLKIVCSPHSGR